VLNIPKIKNGVVMDHIKAGQGIRIFNWLGLDQTTDRVAFLINATSSQMGRKDIIKIDNTIAINFDILGLIDPNITVNIIENELIREKIQLSLPKRVENVLRCKNPRCITSTETYVSHIFHLESAEQRTYRCEYCDEIRTAGEFI
jgi:aspartate carbamoyltransferase regulatory subunit